MEIWIDDQGEVRDAGAVAEDAVCKLGFIHIRVIGRSAAVSLRPALVNPVTMCGAVSELARLDLEWTFIHSGSAACEMLRGYLPAIYRINALLEAEGKVKAYPNYEELLAEAREFARVHRFTDC